MAKLSKQIRRTERELFDFGPGEKIALDFHDFEPDDKGYNRLMLLTDRISRYSWDYYMQDKKAGSIIAALQSFLGMLERQYGVNVKAIECDNEIVINKPRIKAFLERRHIRIEPSPPHTQALNGAAERSGGVVKDRANALRHSARLPVGLWREYTKTAVYLLNRTPRYRLRWKTPFEVLFSKDGIIRKPNLSNLRVYGCRAYAMTVKAMKKEERLKRFEPRAWVGFLVGYASSNTYRIWNPVKNVVIHTRDVIFDERRRFSGRFSQMQDEIKEMSLEELSRTLCECALPEDPEEQIDPVPILDSDADLQLDQDEMPVAGQHDQDGTREVDARVLHGVEPVDARVLHGVEPVDARVLHGVEPVDAHVLHGVEPVDAHVLHGVEPALQAASPDWRAPEASPAERQASVGIGSTDWQAVEASPAQWQASESSRDDARHLSSLEPSAYKHTEARFEPIPTPPPSPPAALLAAVMTGSARTGVPRWGWELGGAEGAHEQGVAVQHSAFHASGDLLGETPSRRAWVPPTDAWKGAFYAGMKSTVVQDQQGRHLTRQAVERRLRNGIRIRRIELPKPPKHHLDLDWHPMGALFKMAEIEHLKSHEEMRSWTEISRKDPQAKGHKILNCKWVYVYKFDKHGRFVKAKARLVVRGDQQLRGAAEDNYAATLAGRSFRTIMAIAARFDLELLQYDAVNAFVNAKLDEDIFMRMPPGHRRTGTIFKLNKALYGLRRSPLLWQRTLSRVLKSIGFKPVPHEPCAFTKNGMIIFFYVDDIVLAFRKQQSEKALQAIDHLRARFRLTGGSALQWFLGIEILRDRKSRLIWLSQSSYLKKIADLAQSTPSSSTPMSREELLPYGGTASNHEIRVYMRKVGSLLYAAVITRPDIAFAVSRLARFTTNPGPDHQKAADRVLRYLECTSSLALQFGGDDHFRVASDASFADNTLDRKSSQAYAMKLFGGLIGWRANKQDTVTTSTTEAELLALSQAAREALFVNRLVKELGVRLDESHLKIECDNQQTIRIVNAEIATNHTPTDKTSPKTSLQESLSVDRGP
jgi:hypothetical protein